MDIISMRRQSRVSSHASLPEHKSEAASNERSTRSRTSSENLVVMELPKIIRTKRSSHQRSGAEGHDPVKNGKGGGGAPSSEGAASRQGLRNAEHSASNNKEAPVAVDHQGGGDAKNLGRTRRRSGRLTSTSEESEKASKQQLDMQKEGRSLRRRTRSGAVTDHVDNGPSEKPKETQADNPPPDPHDSEVRGAHKTSTMKTQPEETNRSDPCKGIADASSSNHEMEKLPESTSSVHKEPDSLDYLQTGSGETDLHMETAAPPDDGPFERPQTVVEKVARLELSLETSEGSLSRTSLRTRTRQIQSLPVQHKDLLPNDKGEASSDPCVADPHLTASNGVRGKTTPRKRTRHSSTSISPRKPPENQEAVPVVPGSPKRRRTGSVCRDLSQDFNTAKPSSSGPEVALPLDPKTECNNDIQAEPRNSTLNVERIPAATAVGDSIENDSLKIASSLPEGNAGAAVETDFVEAVVPQRSRRRSGTSPRGTPHKQAQLDLTKSPARRGLRSGGMITEAAPSEVTESPGVPANDCVIKPVVTPTASPIPSTRKSPGKKKSSSKKDSVPGKGSAKDLDEGRGEPGDGLRFSREDVDYQAEEWYEDVDETEPFYFESDHMAIKGNKDYRMLLRTLTTLEAQRKQAIQDLDRLLECREKALRNPIKFVHKLQHKESLNLPHSQRVVTCPNIDWQRYVGPPETNELLGLVSQHRSMRPTKAASTVVHAQAVQPKPVPMAPPAVPPPAAGVPVAVDLDLPSTSTTSNTGQSADAVELKQEQKMDIVRGRVAEGNKPVTFNQLWTRDEQRRLEEFLVKFPTEEVEARRWEKIAKALGNRTSQQVASRVQKYFIKLMKAGMPVPGRLPNMTTYQTYRKGSKKMHAFTRPLYQPSTFLQSIQPPVYMEEDNPYSPDFMDDDDDELVSDDESIPTDVRDTAEYQELIRLKLMKRKRVRHEGHLGFRCDGCDMEPIVGVRWHCMECPDPVSTDLCQSCVDRNFSSNHHSSSHQMEPVPTNYSQSFVDGDYTSFEPSSGDYNYLDPNYNPMQAT